MKNIRVVNIIFSRKNIITCKFGTLGRRQPTTAGLTVGYSGTLTTCAWRPGNPCNLRVLIALLISGYWIINV